MNARYISAISSGLVAASLVAHSTDDALLATLGLTEDTADAASTPTPAETVSEVSEEAEAPTKAPRTEIKITGEIASGVRKGLPVLVRTGFGGGGKKGSKYPFESLAAPVGPDAEGLYDFANFMVLLSDVENADPKKLQGALQAATAAQNKTAKDEGTTVRFQSFSVLGDNEEYIGTQVFRVDDKA